MNLKRNIWIGTIILLPVVSFLYSAQHRDRSVSPDIAIKPDIVYGHKYGLALTMDMYQPKNHNGAAVLFMNSGGFVSGQLKQYEIVDGEYRFVGPDELLILPYKFHYPPLEQWSFQELLANGFTIFDIRHGSSPKFTLDEIVGDVRRGIRFAKYHAEEFNIDPHRIGLAGASAGGYLAIFLAVSADEDIREAGSQILESGDEIDRIDTKVQAVATWYPAGYDFLVIKESSPEAYKNLPALHIDDEILDSLSIKRYISPNDPPVYIIYGNEDFPFLIIEACQAIHRDCQKHGVESKLIEIPGTGHEFRGQNNEYHAQHGKRAMSDIVAWFKMHLITR